MDKMDLSTIVVMGLQSVGKTTIVERIMERGFNKKVKPTLATQFYNLIVQNTNFRILDLPGQEKLRQSWYNKTFTPSGLIYVIDIKQTEAESLISKKEFDSIVHFLFEADLIYKIPILILGNKVDLGKNDDFFLENVFWDIGDFNYRLSYCSALKNEGIKDAFLWLIGEIMKNQGESDTDVDQEP